MMRVIVLCLFELFAIAIIPSTAYAVFLTYAQWAALAQDERIAYIEGAFDSLITFTSDTKSRAMARHYLDCLVQTKMTNQQLAENVRRFADFSPVCKKGLYKGH